MSSFKIHNLETAPAKSKELLEGSLKGFGMIPNLHGVMAESPAVLEAYKTVHRLFSQETSFSAEEQTVIWQTINVANKCHYCVPAHTAIAHSQKVDAGITESLRNNAPLADAKLEALRKMTRNVIQNSGNVESSAVQEFEAAGYTNKHMLEIFLGYSQKIMSNYTNHVAQTPVDEPFKAFAWQEPAGV